MKPLTTYQISQMVNVNITTVIDWIDKGLLKAYKTPGGHRRVKPSDLLKFLKKYKMPIPDVIAKDVGADLAARPVAISKKVLIVDDDKDILEFISRALKKFYKNIKIEFASDGFMAGKKIAEFKPNLLILDIKMPGMDGFEVLKHLRVGAGLPAHNMKILAITGYPSKEIKEKILKAGADDYLVKPFSVEELKQKVENLMGGKK